jgi:ABC-2 type transport system permease protein/oleandomycin transport system permease protein
MTTAAAAIPHEPTFRPAPQHGSAIGWAVRDTFAMTGRNLTAMRRLPQVLVFSLVQPVIFVLMFRYVFGGAITIPGQDYVDYLMPGIFVQTATFGAINTAIGLAEDKNKGLLERLRTLPMSRSAVLSGRVLADTVRNVVIVTLMFAIGSLVGFRTHTNALMVVVGIAVLIMFGLALSALFALIGLSVTNGEAAQAAAFPLLAPLTFASNLFVDPDTMPGWLQAWARHQPVSVTADAVRACMLGGPTASKVIISLVWAVGIAIVMTPLAVQRYRRT